MKFVEHAVWGSSAPLLAGCYEAEIQPAVESLIDSRPDRVVDIGAAEGYYTVGLALRIPTRSSMRSTPILMRGEPAERWLRATASVIA